MLTTVIDRMPQVGETLDAHGFEKALGGKGANQALTVGKLGGNVEMLAQLGQDETGRKYLEYFKSFNVGTQHVKLLDGQDTGTVEDLLSARASVHHFPEGWQQLDHHSGRFQRSL